MAMLQEERLPVLETEKLSSSYIPSDVELEQIPSILKAKRLQQNLDRYNHEIEKLSDMLAALRAQRDNLQHDMDQYKAVISPARRIPIEVLTDIFSFCCFDGGNHAYSLEISTGRVFVPTLILSQTCSLWRNIVKALPKLWSRLSINLARIGKGTTNLVELYLRCSADKSLGINLFAHDAILDERYSSFPYADKLTASGWSVFFSILKEHIRWNDVRIDCHCYVLDAEHIGEYVDNPASWTSGHFEALRSLSLVCDDEAYFNSNHFFRMIRTKNTPLLDCLELEHFLSEDLIIKFSGLRRLTIRTVGNDANMFELFKNSTKLEEVVIFADWFDIEEEPEEREVITHEKLRSVKMEAEGPETFHAALMPFSFLTLPALVTLDLSNSIGNDSLYSAKNYLIEMLVRSSCALKVLKLSGDLFLSDEDLLDVLRLTPTVTRFTLDTRTRYFTQRFFCALALDNGPLSSSSRPHRNILLPCLKEFKLAFEQEQSSVGSGTKYSLPDVAIILKMLNSRKSYSNALGLEQLTVFEISARLLLDPASQRWGESLRSDLCIFPKERMELKANVIFL
ncbi:hypothetical protein VKT23_006530 [Stygiomarasmius scandens]|uniref:F-box domain-containing protein n=1 Tax=Marasmiellus scandens TaxID=2682957 RepID=A0ABR1JN11_9AGAR